MMQHMGSQAKLLLRNPALRELMSSLMMLATTLIFASCDGTFQNVMPGREDAWFRLQLLMCEGLIVCLEDKVMPGLLHVCLQSSAGHPVVEDDIETCLCKGPPMEIGDYTLNKRLCIVLLSYRQEHDASLLYSKIHVPSASKAMSQQRITESWGKGRKPTAAVC